VTSACNTMCLSKSRAYLFNELDKVHYLRIAAVVGRRCRTSTESDAPCRPESQKRRPLRCLAIAIKLRRRQCQLLHPPNPCAPTHPPCASYADHWSRGSLGAKVSLALDQTSLLGGELALSMWDWRQFCQHAGVPAHSRCRGRLQSSDMPGRERYYP
jgi:hypothetical protein